MALQFIPVAVEIGVGIVGAIRTFLGWFGSGGAVAILFAHLGAKITAKSAAIAWQIVSIALLFFSRLTFGYAVFEVLRLSFNALNYFVTSIPTYLTSSSIGTLAYTLMRSIGLIDAFNDAFVIFNTLFIAIVMAYLTRFAFQTVKMTSDEYFKLSVLIQQ